MFLYWMLVPAQMLVIWMLMDEDADHPHITTSALEDGLLACQCIGFDLYDGWKAGALEA